MSKYSPEEVKNLILNNSKSTGNPYIIGTNLPANEKNLNDLIKELEQLPVEDREDYFGGLKMLIASGEEIVAEG